MTTAHEPERLRVLVLEDREDDAELMVLALSEFGYVVQWQRVDDEASYLAALDPTLDVVLADYSLPGFGVLTALRQLQERGLSVPFIVVSGTISEEVAVDCVKRGAADYLVKDRLARLPQAVAAAVEQRRLRDANEAAVEELRRSATELNHLATHDALTGLLNRRGFEAQLDVHVAAAVARRTPGALLVLDLDHFKQVNDTLGHHRGDELIVTAAQLLSRAVRSSDVVARLGGDEFAVILPSADLAGAEQVAQTILAMVRAEPALARRRVTTSIGLALFDHTHPDPQDVLVSADLCMYDAKDGGRDRVVCTGSAGSPPPRTKERLAWVDRLHRALEEDRLVLYAQPIRPLSHEQPPQHELLVRMIDDDGSVVSPGAFLAIAERTGLIGLVDRWVATRAIELLADPRLPAGTVLEINLSALSIGDDELLASIEEQLDRTGADARRLIIEITETSAMSNIVNARRFADRLSQIGCRFAIDDFGAGYGSFYYLKHMPFDYLKIDGEFVVNCATNATDQLTIESVVNIARALRKKTIAEFVGDEETAEFLRSLGVDYAQGYGIGRPEPVETILIGGPDDARHGPSGLPGSGTSAGSPAASPNLG